MGQYLCLLRLFIAEVADLVVIPKCMISLFYHDMPLSVISNASFGIIILKDMLIALTIIYRHLLLYCEV
jgi:uncharacterized membrane protein